MYYMVNNDCTLLHQSNDDINKVYQTNRPISIYPLIFCDNVYKLNALYCSVLVHETNSIFKHDMKVAILKKNKEKSLVPTDFIKHA